MKKWTRAAALLLAALLLCACAQTKAPEAQTGFVPKLDTKKSVTLDTVGFFGNFEALDQVINDFNAYYPNVDFTYEQVGGELGTCLTGNPGVDIFMVSRERMGKETDILREYCVNLSETDVDVSDIIPEYLTSQKVDGGVVAIPMGQNVYGIVVNKTLLEKAGLAVPQTYGEFLEVLAALKEQGYTPIQGPTSKVYAELTEGMVLDLIASDENLREQLAAGDPQAAQAIAPVLDKLETLVTAGYTDLTVNETYPQDNYDQAILRFFEGDVPFWVCNSEKVSGMKKRESKSEAFQASPFEYAFLQVPLGENGVYAYSEAWYGFSVNKNSEVKDYAVEFLRFMAQKEELNKMADIKGIPSVAKQPTDSVLYSSALSPAKTEMVQVDDGVTPIGFISAWYEAATRYGKGELTKEAALQEFLEKCAK